MSGCSKLTTKYGYPDSAVKKAAKLEVVQKKKSKNGKFDQGVLFPKSEDKIYPMEYDGIYFDTMNIKVVFDREKTGFCDGTNRKIELKVGKVLLGRFEIVAILGSGVFATVVKVKDLLS